MVGTTVGRDVIGVELGRLVIGFRVGLSVVGHLEGDTVGLMVGEFVPTVERNCHAPALSQIKISKNVEYQLEYP